MDSHPPPAITPTPAATGDAPGTAANPVELWQARLDEARAQRRQGETSAAIAATRDSLAEPLPAELRVMALHPLRVVDAGQVRIHTHPNHRLDELLPHRWRPA